MYIFPYTSDATPVGLKRFSNKFVSKLLLSCFWTEDELSKVREQQEADKVLTGYYGKYATCRNLSYEEIEKNIK